MLLSNRFSDPDNRVDIETRHALSSPSLPNPIVNAPSVTISIKRPPSIVLLDLPCDAAAVRDRVVDLHSVSDT